MKAAAAAYAYPAPRTGTAQDLIRVVTRAYELELEKSGLAADLPRKSEAQRRFADPVFRAVGVAFGGVAGSLPADWVAVIQDRIMTALAAPHTYPFQPDAPAMVRARALAARLKERTGREPALIALLSHPPVVGEFRQMNIEVVRHAALVLRSVRGRACRPRLVAGIDPFALDTFSLVRESMYAGYMGSYHLGIDRLALGRARSAAALTPHAAWTKMPQRMFRKLAEGGEAGIFLAGGVPATARVLYGVREWIRCARSLSPRRRDPALVARSLGAEPVFARFKAAAADALHLPSSTWRVVDMWLMASEAGLLPEEAPRAAARAALEALDVPEAARARLLAELSALSDRETPHRGRLFRVLAGRVARARPLVLIPIIHSTRPLGVAVREAWGWCAAARGRVAAFRGDAPDAAVETTAESFAGRFVTENFA